MLPVLLGAYLWQIRRRRRRAVTYSSVALIRAAAPARSAWRRHVPFALVLAVLACLGVAAARPQIRTDVPVAGSAVILALDVSGSMCATDVDPNRLSAAQAAVRDFVRRQDSSTRIGLVVFSGFAQVAVAPTTERDELFRAIDSLTTGRGTTIGAAILKAVDAIAQINPDVAPADAGSSEPDGLGPAWLGAPRVVRAGDRRPAHGRRQHRRHRTGGRSQDRRRARRAGLPDRVRDRPPDGDGLHGGAAGRSRVRHLRSGWLRPWSAAGARCGGNFLVADDATLKKVASVTGGAFFSASDADQLQSVLKGLPRQVKIQQRDVEVSVVFVGLATLLLLLTVWAAARWTAFPT